MKHIIILTGPAGAGKNTIGYLLAKKRTTCAVIDVDLVRWMFYQPHKGPWEGDDGLVHQKIGVENACMLARNFIHHTSDVILLDVVTNTTASLYRKLLKDIPTTIVLLLPTFEETQARLRTREFRITKEEEHTVYTWQEALTDYDLKLDNTQLSAETVVKKLEKCYV